MKLNLEGFKQLAKQSKNNNFLEMLKDQNKNKEWSWTPIEISIEDNKIVTNATNIKSEIDKIDTSLRQHLQTVENVEDVESYQNILKIISDWLKGTRIELTTPFDTIKSEFTSNETKLKNLIDTLKTKKDELLEAVYAKRRIHIMNFFQTLEDDLEDDIELKIDFKVFNSFADEKKKLKSFDLNTKGQLSTPAQRQIKDQFEMVVNPIIEQIRLNELKEKEQALLTKELSNIKTSGTIEDLEQSKVKLTQLIESLHIFYQNIKSNAQSQIYNTISIVEGNIRALQKVEKYQQQKESIKSLDDRKNEIRGIFEKPYGQMDLSLQDVNFLIEDLENYDFSQFGELSQFAYDICNIQLNNLKKIKYAIEQKEKQSTNDIQNIDKKIVIVNAKLQFQANLNTQNSFIIDKVTKLLKDAGLSESIVNVEVV